jgi:hypothetical protein
MAGMPFKVKVAHLRLCHSRMFLAIAYPRETQEMVFDAHQRAFEFFEGICRRGIYDKACQQALKVKTVNQEAILNLLYRSKDTESTTGIDPGFHLQLKCQPVADCGRYDCLITEVRHAAQ